MSRLKESAGITVPVIAELSRPTHATHAEKARLGTPTSKEEISSRRGGLLISWASGTIGGDLRHESKFIGVNHGGEGCADQLVTHQLPTLLICQS